MSRPYRPSNGTEGEMFQEYWCNRCKKLDYERDIDCDILARSFWFQIGDPQYPTEWIEDERGPEYVGICTAFESKNDQS